MRYVAAYLLSGLGGKEHPTAEDIEAILGSVGVECNKERLNQVINELKGKKIEDLISAGKEKLATFLVAPTEGNNEVKLGLVQDTEQEVAKEVQEEKKEETEESDDDLGFGLFD